MTSRGRALPAAAAAVAVAASVAGAVLERSSWWGVAFAGAVAATMLALRPVVPVPYRAGWTRSVLLVSLGAVCAGGTYAFAVPPFGPAGTAFAFLVPLLLVAAWLAKGAGQVGASAQHRSEWERAYMSGKRRF